MLNSFFAAACAAVLNPGATSAAATTTGNRREIGFMGQSSRSIGLHGIEDWRDSIDANPAIEVSRAFIPPCTRAISPPDRQLSDQTPYRQAGTLATNSAVRSQYLCQGNCPSFSIGPAVNCLNCGHDPEIVGMRRSLANSGPSDGYVVSGNR